VFVFLFRTVKFFRRNEDEYYHFSQYATVTELPPTAGHGTGSASSHGGTSSAARSSGGYSAVVCGGPERRRHVVTSRSNHLQMRVIPSRDARFLIKFEGSLHFDNPWFGSQLLLKPYIVKLYAIILYNPCGSMGMLHNSHTNHVVVRFALYEVIVTIKFV
jgi:hypothetical protein